MANTSTSAVVSYIAPIMDKALKKNEKAMLNNIRLCFRARADMINDTCPCDRIYFGQDDVDAFFKAVGVSVSEVTEALSKAYFWNIKDFNPQAAKDEFTEAVLMCVRYFLMKKDKNNAELTSIYLAFSGKFYPSIHYGRWKVSPPSEHREVMEYVVNMKLSNKFDLKREGSVWGAVKSLTVTWLNTYADGIMKGDDEDIKNIIQQLHGRIKSFLTNIAEEYYAAYAAGEYMTYDSSNMDAENGGYRIADTVSQKADRQTEKAVLYVTQNRANYKIAAMCKDKNVSESEVYNIVNAIQSDTGNVPEIKELISITIHEYYTKEDGPKIADRDVRSIDFVSWAIAPKPNTKNPHILRQKEIITKWLNMYSDRFRKSKRAETISSYYKSIMKYYALIINESNK